MPRRIGDGTLVRSLNNFLWTDPYHMPGSAGGP